MIEFETPPCIELKMREMASGLRTKSRWWHDETESPPAEYPAGPLVGTQKQIGAWLYGDHIRDSRRLADKARRGVVWGRKIHKRLYEVWFRDESSFNRAYEQKLKDEAGKN